MSRRKVINIVLGALLIVSLIGNVALNKTVANAETKLNKLQQDLQEGKKAVAEKKEELKQSQETLEANKKKNEELKQALAKKPSDPNKVLTSGMTLLQARGTIDSLIANYKLRGETVEQHQADIEAECKKLGTTYQEIKNIPESALQQTQEVKQQQTQALQQAQPKVVQQAPAQQSTTVQQAPKVQQSAPVQQAPQVQQSAPAQNNSSDPFAALDVADDGGQGGYNPEFDAQMAEWNK